MQRRPRKWFWRITALVVVLLLGALVWGGWYVYYRGFTRKWREQLAAELRSRGLDFQASRLTLNPFEGLVVENARICLLDEHHTPLLSINRAAVDINYANLILKKPFLNSLDLRGARLKLPMDMSDPGGPKFRLRKFQAKLSFQPGEVRITQAEGDCYGVRLSLSGTLLNPERFTSGGPPESPEGVARRRQIARSIIEELQKLRAEQTPPRLEVRFTGDLAKLEAFRASAELRGGAIRRGNFRLERVYLRLDYEAAAFRLRQAEFFDGRGALAAEGDFNPASGNARFQLQNYQGQSVFDLLALAREFYPPAATALAAFRFTDPPRLQLSGQAHFGSSPTAAAGQQTRAVANPAPPLPALQLTGRADVGRFAWQAIDFRAAETEFTWRDGSWYLRGLRLSRPGPGGQQQIDADVLSQPGQARARVNAEIDPAIFAALLPARGRNALSEWEFHDPPRVELTAVGASFDDPEALRLEGHLTLGRTKFRRVGLNRLQTDFTLANRAVAYRHFTLERDEGTATGDEFVYDFGHHESRVQNVRASLDPAQVSVWIDPEVARAVAPFRFRKPPTTVTNGVVQFDGGRNSHLTIDINAPAGVDYTFVRKPLGPRAVTGQLLFTDDRLRLNDMKAQIFDGEAKGSLDLSLARGAPNYTAQLDFDGVDFAKVTKLYFGFDDSKGRLSGSYRFRGRGDDARTLKGAGALRIEQGSVFAIPFLGPLSAVLGGMNLGLGYDLAREGSVDFLTANGKIYTGNLNAKGTGFSLFGAGWLGYADDTMNFRVRINSRGLPGVVLYPVSKLFEYSSAGPLAKPVWKPRIFNAETPGPDAAVKAPPTPSAGAPLPKTTVNPKRP